MEVWKTPRMNNELGDGSQEELKAFEKNGAENMKFLKLVVVVLFAFTSGSMMLATAQADASPKVKRLVQEAFDCEDRGDDRCVLDKFRDVLRERDLPLNVRELIQDRLVLELSAFISDHGESIAHEEYWSICQEGIGLIKSQGRDKGLEALQFYIRGAIINHEMGSHVQKRTLIKEAKEAMNQSSRWSDIEGRDISEEVRQEGLRWAQRAIDRME